MNDQSSMSGPMICADTGSAISSPALEDGHTLSGSPDGPTTDLFGLALAPASRSVPQARVLSSQMTDTYGRHGSGSSASAALTLSLANRFQARTHSLGSTMFQLTWKQRVTPSGRSIPAQRASAPRTSGNDCISWPTPRTPTGGAESARRKQELGRTESGGGDLQAAALLASWPTPNAGPQNDTDSQWEARREAVKAKRINGNGFGMTLGMAATLSSWATPSARDHKDSSDPATWNCTEERDRYDQLPRQAQLSHWQTPATDSFRSRGGDRKNEMGLDQQARTALLPTASGPTLNGSPAATASGGQLNPALPRWLQGYPTVWDDLGATVTRSTRRSPPNSSAPQSMPSTGKP